MVLGLDIMNTIMEISPRLLGADFESVMTLECASRGNIACILEGVTYEEISLSAEQMVEMPSDSALQFLARSA